MTRKQLLNAAINSRRESREVSISRKNEMLARSTLEWEKYIPSRSVPKLPEITNAVWERRKYLLKTPIRISHLARLHMEELFLYSGPNYKRQALANQYRELMEDNPERAREPHVVRWYVKKWRKIR